MSGQNSVMLEPVHAILVDIGLWPPSMKNKKPLHNATIKLDFSLGLSFGSGQEVAKPRPPWPPPMLIEFMGCTSQLMTAATCVFDSGEKVHVEITMIVVLQVRSRCLVSSQIDKLFHVHLLGIVHLS
jgi:acetolactate synthase regulatory subunit